MKSANNPPAEFIDQIRHDLKPVLLGIRAVLQDKSLHDKAASVEILQECEKKLQLIIDSLNCAPGRG